MDEKQLNEVVYRVERKDGTGAWRHYGTTVALETARTLIGRDGLYRIVKVTSEVVE